jgi:hypothetical protein
MRDTVLESFLEAQCQEAMALAAQSDIVDVRPVEGVPPQRFLARFQAKGLVQSDTGEIHEASECVVGIWLPDNYLDTVIPAQVLTYLGPHERPWHPNIRAPWICAHLRPGTPLVDVLHTVYELWTWQLWSTSDEGLNHAASQWARHQDTRRFPVDARPLKRRNVSVKVNLLSEDKASCKHPPTP